MIREEDIRRFKDCATPFYFYDLERLTQVATDALSAASKYGYHIHYAMKANTNERILKTFVELGFGADCVSGAEVEAALAVGFRPGQVAFAGVGKTDTEIDLAIANEIFTLNVESIEELYIVNERAKLKGTKASIALRLNPDVDAQTHKYITTGLEENKFGISGWQLQDVMDAIRELEHITLKGLHFHIGSQIRSLEPFKNLCFRVNHAIQRFEESGLRIEHLNLGGGLGIDYGDPDGALNPNFETFFKMIHDHLEPRPYQEVHFELGRALVATCGDLISRVLFVKRGLKTNFLILDAGMTELIRPALYQSVHPIENLSASQEEEVYDVVGPVCESSDCFGKAVRLPRSERGNLIAIRCAGAYGESMASHYNLRSLQITQFSEAQKNG